MSSIFSRFGSSFLEFLVALSDAWYDSQADGLTVLWEAFLHRRRRRRGRRHLAGGPDTAKEIIRRAIASEHSADWERVEGIVREELSARSDHLRTVYEMLLYMGLSDDQARTVLDILCSNPDISDDIRSDLVTLYKECVMLRPFVVAAEDAATVPLTGTENVLRTSEREKRLLFLIRVQQCLPLADNPARLESFLSQTIGHIRGERVKSGLMEAAGVCPISLPPPGLLSPSPAPLLPQPPPPPHSNSPSPAATTPAAVPQSRKADRPRRQGIVYDGGTTGNNRSSATRIKR